MKRLNEELKIDIGLVAQALNNSNVTGRYYDVSNYRKVLAVLNAGAMADTKTTKVEILQAKDAAGTDAKGIPSTADQDVVATITANTLVTTATLTLATVLAGDKVTINGLVFTAAAAADLPNRVFAQAGDDTADAASLVSAINHATAGVPGITATSALGVVTLVADDPGEILITITDAAATITPATTQAIAYVEVDVAQMDTNNGFTHLAVKVTTTANTVVSADLLRGDARFTPIQKVGAAAAL
ncbi:MAG: hypothetical protein ABFD18_06275 [Syntrophomonas sp.]